MFTAGSEAYQRIDQGGTGLGLVGSGANSPYAVMGENMSEGRLYDRIGDTERA